MTITGLVGHLGMGRQDAMITDAELAAYEPTLTDYYVITSESFQAANNPLVAENEIGRGRARTGAVAGGYAISGGFGGYARVSDLGKLLGAALSNDESALSADGSTGVSTIVPTDYLDWFTFEKNVGDTLYLWLVNAKCNTINISVNANQIAQYTSEWVLTTEKMIVQEDAGSPSYTDDDLLAFHGGEIKINGTAYSNMESLEVVINNNLSNDEYTVRPSRFLNNVTEGAQTIDLNFNQVFQTADDYAHYTYGAVGRTSPGYDLFEDDVYFLLMNAQAKVNATQWMEFYFPRVMFGGLPVTLASGRIVVSNTGTVLAPNVGNIITVLYK